MIKEEPSLGVDTKVNSNYMVIVWCFVEILLSAIYVHKYQRK